MTRRPVPPADADPQPPGTVQGYERIELAHGLVAVLVLDPAARAARKTPPPPEPKRRQRR